MGLPCSGHHAETPQKSERWEGSWPYGQDLITTHNNQPEINDSGRRDVGERARGGWSVWGDVVHRLGDDWDNDKKDKMNHAKAEDGCRLMRIHTATNQK